MKIAMVSEHASPLAALGGVDAGGQNVHVAELALGLSRTGHDVVVHTRRDDVRLESTIALDGVRVDHVDAGPPTHVPKDALLPHMDEFARELRKRWIRDRPDVVHSHFWMSGYAALKAASDLDIPVVHTFHALGIVKRRFQGEADTSPEGRIEIEKSITRRADRIVTTCTDEVFELVRLGADRSRLSVIPCGVDLERFRPAREPGEAERPGNRLISVGRLVPRKGVGNVISALGQLPDAELTVVGGPPQEGLEADPEARRLMDLAAEVGVSDRVRFTGRVPHSHLPGLMRESTIAVAVPWYEPFGIVPLEAMACDTPVVASAVGGLIDSVVDGVTGVHVPARDPERLAEVLADLLADPAKRRRLGQAGARRARDRFGWERIAGATLDVYREVAAEAGNLPAPGIPTGEHHLDSLRKALEALEPQVDELEEIGSEVGHILSQGGRLLAAGNGGSAAQAQHLTAELVGRYRTERDPLSAICLHGDSSSLTAIANDYGAEEAFARQVRGHGRAGDVFIALSTSGQSRNVIAAIKAARDAGMRTVAFTGARPSPAAELSHHAFRAPSNDTATVQELHLVGLHVFCGAVDRELDLGTDRAGSEQRVTA